MPNPTERLAQIGVDQPQTLATSQIRRAYALLLVRALFPAVTLGDAQKAAAWIEAGS